MWPGSLWDLETEGLLPALSRWSSRLVMMVSANFCGARILFVGVLGAGGAGGGRRYLEGLADGGMEVPRDSVIPWGEGAGGGSRQEQGWRSAGGGRASKMGEWVFSELTGHATWAFLEALGLHESSYLKKKYFFIDTEVMHDHCGKYISTKRRKEKVALSCQLELTNAGFGYF